VEAERSTANSGLLRRKETRAMGVDVRVRSASGFGERMYCQRCVSIIPRTHDQSIYILLRFRVLLRQSPRSYQKPSSFHSAPRDLAHCGAPFTPLVPFTIHKAYRVS
jgi:hypothetical protein